MIVSFTTTTYSDEITNEAAENEVYLQNDVFIEPAINENANAAAFSVGWDQANGVWYYYDPATGMMIYNDWIADGGYWYYFGWDGAMYANTWVAWDGAWYYLGHSGAMVASDWIGWNGAWYYLGASGAMYANEWMQWNMNNAWYYLRFDGMMLSGGTFSIPQYGNCIFDANGIWRGYEQVARSIFVGTQTETLTAGASGTVTYNVTTENIPNGNYPVTVSNLPTGVSSLINITVQNNNGLILLYGSANTIAGTFSNIKVSFGGAESNYFSLTISLSGVLKIPPLSNNTHPDIEKLPSNPMEIQNDAVILQFSGNLIYTGQIIEHTFTAAESGRYRFGISGMTSGNVKLEIYNSVGTLIASTGNGNAGNGGGVTSDNINGGETYKIRVVQNNGLVSYNLSVGCQKPEINVTGKTDIKDSIQFTGQCNQYKWTAPLVSGRYRFGIYGLSNGYVYIEVYNSSGSRIGYNSYTSNNAGCVIDNIVGGETYNIRIYQNNGLSSYTLHIGYQKPEVDLKTLYNAVTDSIQYASQYNQYKWTAPPVGGRYRFEIGGLSSGRVSIEVYNSSWTRVGSYGGVSNGGGVTIDNMVANGVYYIRVIEYNILNSYTLYIRYQKPTVDISENIEVEDSIQYTSQINNYTWKAPSNGQFRFEITGLTAGNVRIEVYNSFWDPVGSIGNAGNGGGVNVNNIVAGQTYYIRIIQNNGFSPYKLRIN